jgi:hypothetical protein
VSCWIAPRDVTPGRAYGEAIIRAIEECAVCLLILSEKSNLSKPVHQEIERAFSYAKTIIPLRIREVTPAKSIEFFISSSQWVDAFSSPIADRVEFIAAVVQAVAAGRPAPSAGPERSGVMARVERALERSLRHKMLSAGIAFVALVMLGVGGLVLQRSTQATVERAAGDIAVAAADVRSSSASIETSASSIQRTGQDIERGLAGVRRETSEDPRKELSNLSVPWTAERFLEAVTNGDQRIIQLFLQGGMEPTTRYSGCTVIWYAVGRGMSRARQTLDLFVAAGFDINALLPCSPSASSGDLSANIFSTSIMYRNAEVTEALLELNVRVTSQSLALFQNPAVRGTPFAQRFEPLVRERLNQRRGDLPSDASSLLAARGISPTPEGVAEAIRLFDIDGLKLLHELKVTINHDAVFTALSGLMVNESPSFSQALDIVRSMGFDINRPSRDPSVSSAPPQDLLTVAVRLRSDAMTRALLAQGARPAPPALRALETPYGSMFGGERNPGYVPAWRSELARLAASSVSQSNQSWADGMGPAARGVFQTDVGRPVPAAVVPAAPPQSVGAAVAETFLGAEYMQTRIRANIRAQPIATGALVGVLEVAVRVEVLPPSASNRGWRAVRTADGREGWVSSDLLEPIAADGSARGSAVAGTDTAWILIGSRSFRLVGVHGAGGYLLAGINDFLRERGGITVCEPTDGAYACTLNGRDLGSLIVRTGAGRAIGERYTQQEREARQNRLGMWRQ